MRIEHFRIERGADVRPADIVDVTRKHSASALGRWAPPDVARLAKCALPTLDAEKMAAWESNHGRRRERIILPTNPAFIETVAWMPQSHRLSRMRQSETDPLQSLRPIFEESLSQTVLVPVELAEQQPRAVVREGEDVADAAHERILKRADGIERQEPVECGPCVLFAFVFVFIFAERANGAGGLEENLLIE
jgi:hypothetical protein